MAKKKPDTPKSISNRRARHDYALDDGTIVGIQLTGKETKALRMGHGHLKGAYITLKDGELWLINSTVNSTNNIRLTESEQTRNRKLLAKRKEIDQFALAKQQGKTLLPLEILTQGRYIKVRIAPGRGLKKYDKRQILRKRDEQLNIQRNLR